MEEKYLNIKINLKRNNEFKLIEYKYKKEHMMKGLWPLMFYYKLKKNNMMI